MTGFWVGHYRYSNPGEPVIPFLAMLEDANGSLTGTISEPDEWSNDRLGAIVFGTRVSSIVDFKKTYDGAGSYFHSVDYSGFLSTNGLELVGEWQLAHHHGSFRMTRESVEIIDEEAEVFSEISAQGRQTSEISP